MSSKAGKERLLQLLDYVQHIVRLPERARFSVKDSGSFVYLQENLHDRIGVQLDVRDDQGPVWLKVVRLQRIDPPELPEELRPWITMMKNPLREPKVAAELTQTVTEKEGHKLVDKGLVDPEEVKKLRKRSPDKEKLVQVRRRLQKDGALSEAIGQYLTGPWRRWAEMEKPRRASMKIYNDFFKLHQALQAGAVAAPVEVIWGIGVAVWKTGRGTIKHPLIEVLVEIDVDPKTNEILVRRRAADPQLFIKQFLSLDSPGLVKLQEEGRVYFEKFRRGQDPREFSPFNRDTFEPLLRLATTLLSSSAQYYPDVADDPKGPELPAPTETLQITDTWAIYARPRSDNLFFEDIERLKRIVEDSDFESLQTAARQFVADPSDQPTYQPQRIDLLGKPRGKVAENKAREQPVDDFDLFFPKEYNDAQVKIIHELERSDGVVVQGPPGTGKTHTIANIICHYLATGRRVLVTSQGEPALKVLRQFIPEEIRRLTISLLTKDQEGLQQLETAVTLLANEVTRIVPEQIEKQIIDSEQKLRDLRAQLDKNEQAVRDIAERQLTPRQHELFGDSPCSPSELAQNLAGDRSQHEWLPDTPGLDPAFEPQFTAADVAAAGQARRRLGADLQYLSSKLPTIKNLPDNSKLQEIHQRIIDADQNDPHAQDPDFPKLSVLAEDARERATALIDDLKLLVEIHDLVASYPWLAQLFQTWLELGFDSPATKPFDELVPGLEGVADRVPVFETRPVSMPDLGEHVDAIVAAVERAARERRPFGTLAIGATQPKKLFAEITVDGEPPANAEGWQHVEAYLKLCDDAYAIAGSWNAIAQQFALPLVDEAGATAARSLAEHFDL
ncbi:MAG: AAA domain-containing protein, partial [Planctomycetota bacterium]